MEMANRVRHDGLTNAVIPASEPESPFAAGQMWLKCDCLELNFGLLFSI